MVVVVFVSPYASLTEAIEKALDAGYKIRRFDKLTWSPGKSQTKGQED
jgi:hypothetical protein